MYIMGVLYIVSVVGIYKCVYVCVYIYIYNVGFVVSEKYWESQLSLCLIVWELARKGLYVCVCARRACIYLRLHLFINIRVLIYIFI